MFDVVVIGAGIMGAAVSRELSRYELKTLLLDKEKMERYNKIFEEYKKERTKDFINFVLTAILLILLIAFLFYI